MVGGGHGEGLEGGALPVTLSHQLVGSSLVHENARNAEEELDGGVDHILVVQGHRGRSATHRGGGGGEVRAGADIERQARAHLGRRFTGIYWLKSGKLFGRVSGQEFHFRASVLGVRRGTCRGELAQRDDPAGIDAIVHQALPEAVRAFLGHGLIGGS